MAIVCVCVCVGKIHRDKGKVPPNVVQAKKCYSGAVANFQVVLVWESFDSNTSVHIYVCVAYVCVSVRVVEFSCHELIGRQNTTIVVSSLLIADRLQFSSNGAPALAIGAKRRSVAVFSLGWIIPVMGRFYKLTFFFVKKLIILIFI